MKLAIALLVSLITQFYVVDVRGGVISQPAATVIGVLTLQPQSVVAISKPVDDGSWKDCVEDADDGSYKPQPGNEGEWIDDVTGENIKKLSDSGIGHRLTSIWNDVTEAKISSLPSLQPINKQIVAPTIVAQQHSPALTATVGSVVLDNDGVADGTYAQIPILNGKGALQADVSSTIVANRIATIGPNIANDLANSNHAINQVNSELITNDQVDLSKGLSANHVAVQSIGAGIDPNALIANSVVEHPTKLITNKLVTPEVTHIAAQPTSLLANQLVQKDVSSTSSLVGNQPTVLLTNQPSAQGALSAVNPNTIALTSEATRQQGPWNSNLLVQQAIDTHSDPRTVAILDANIGNEQKPIIAQTAVNQPNPWIANHLATQSINAPLEQNSVLIPNAAAGSLSAWNSNQLATQGISGPLKHNNALIANSDSIQPNVLLANQVVEQTVNTVVDPNKSIGNVQVANIAADQTGALINSNVGLVANREFGQQTALTTNQLPAQDLNGAVDPNVALIGQQPNSWIPNELLQQAIPAAIDQNRPAVADGNIGNAPNTLIANDAITQADVGNTANIIESQPNAWISNQLAAQGVNSPVDPNSFLITNSATNELSGFLPNQQIQQDIAAGAGPITSGDGSITTSQNTLLANANLNQPSQLLANQLVNQNINPGIETVAGGIVRDPNTVRADNGASQQGGWLPNQLQEQRFLIGDGTQQNAWGNDQLAEDAVTGAVDESQPLQIGGVADDQQQSNGIGAVTNDNPRYDDWNSFRDLNGRGVAGDTVETEATAELNALEVLRGAGGTGGPGGAGGAGGEAGADGEPSANGEQSSRVVRTSYLRNRYNLLQLAQNTKSQFRRPIIVA